MFKKLNAGDNPVEPDICIVVLDGICVLHDKCVEDTGCDIDICIWRDTCGKD
ncbi:hypothetical protein [Thermococcus indicus]|uniref:hypothetical protein n=1 Tax=Thermococcus indicus TaxID=2586643 RepID=UPI00143D3086|nr:hypothetical protein [Thermococcus indicus]